MITNGELTPGNSQQKPRDFFKGSDSKFPELFGAKAMLVSGRVRFVWGKFEDLFITERDGEI